MKRAKSIHIGLCAMPNMPQSVQGEIVTLANEKYYKISNYDLMPAFFMSITSNSDLWMFISSNGALTAGRCSPDNALFPYYTDDRIHDSQENTGSKTIIFVRRDDKTFLWEPFSRNYWGVYRIERNIYKNIVGNQLIFEEINHDLGVNFQYAWLNCDRFGLIKKARIKNTNPESVHINFVDGIQNILPAGVDRRLQLEFSTLVDGYKKNELLADTGIALYTLSSIITDRAEPNESLKGTTVWSVGLDKPVILLSTTQLELFRSGQVLEQETEIHGKRGAYFLSSELEMPADTENEWFIVADVDRDQSDVVALSRWLTSGTDVKQLLEEEISKSSDMLKQKIASADGYQTTGDSLTNFRHCSNTLFNIMRGGIFDDGYSIKVTDLQSFISNANKSLIEKHDKILRNLPDPIHLEELRERISSADPDLERLCFEYLPLTFSRRHGDPSRPWNHFSIDVLDDDGNKKLNYEGNWRDIFQNWEALALSYPEFIENMITKFVNACTADGYNPYRVTRDGFDWEVPSPSEAWANIGYWGDHQIIYLSKLLELSVDYHPGKLVDLLTKEIFTYANVPYRIKSYHDILLNPHETIDFDYELHKEIENRVREVGSDGKFIWDEMRRVHHVNLIEKILTLILVKFSNFIPEAGIWMNTQRPEWNDANNALVGYGASMVTLYYLRRFCVFCMDLFNKAAAEKIDISEEVYDLFTTIRVVLEQYQELLNGSISNRDRKEILDHLGQAGSDYRMKIYSNKLSGDRRTLRPSDLILFLETGIKYLDHSIRSNKRDDDLYHSYNLIKIESQDEISIRHMYEMLEGQVAVLSSGYLSCDEALKLIASLRKSALYREDQSSYLLYPDRRLSRFMDKNVIPPELLEKSDFLKSCLKRGVRDIVVQDDRGHVRFNGDMRNAKVLKHALQELKLDHSEMTDEEISLVLDIYEKVFDHQSFTGRSGTFYKYEGLGSIYWHMVSKLLLAVQETMYGAMEARVSPSVLREFKDYYDEIRAGLGSHKNPGLYGAFPTDPYSHTPKNQGAQQPGMTGQVKEDIISRFGELGVTTRQGKIRFNAALLNSDEFLNNSERFDYYDVKNCKQSIELNMGTLAFTICQVPVIYIKSKEQKIVIYTRDESIQEIEGLEMNLDRSRSIFRRENKIWKIEVMV